MKFSGGCLCGAVRYEYDGRPVTVFLCHCIDCKKHGGSLVHYGVLVNEADVKLEGKVAAYASKADSGRDITREFCPTCGSGLTNRLEMAPGKVVLKGGTIDDHPGPNPTFELHTATKSEWLQATGDLIAFEGPAVPSKQLLWKPAAS